jgi:hypothetical protein
MHPPYGGAMNGKEIANGMSVELVSVNLMI